MPLVTTDKMLLDAKEKGYAVPAFNFENMDMARALIEVCSEKKSPVILQTTTSTLKYIPPEICHAIVSYYAEDADIPVALHLDHGASYELCTRCIDAGYTSVMIDGSKLPFDENAALSRKVVDYASKAGIPVECELGKVGGKEDEVEVSDRDALLTDPEEAREFAAITGCSSLAVAIGTAHGFYRKKPELDFDRIKRTAELVDVPLVLHGTSGTDDEDVKKAVSLGMCKVNYATDLRFHFTKGVRKSLEDEGVYDPKEYLKDGAETLKAQASHLIGVCGSAGRA